MDTRTRWIVGVLLALVIGLGVALIIVAADDSGDSAPGTTVNPATERLTEPKPTTTRPTTSTSTGPTGGTPIPGTTTAPNGQGGL